MRLTLCIASLFFLGLSEPAAAQTQSAEVAIPTPEHAVGTTMLVWTDASRTDPTANRGPRQLVVQLWYPAQQPVRRPRAAPYVMEDGIRASIAATVFDENTPADAVRVTTSALLDATPAQGPFPLVLFSSGVGMPRALYTTYLMQLASAGYVVAAIDQPGLGVVAMPDGRVVGPYGPWVSPAPGMRDRSEAARDEYWQTGRTELAADQVFVIEQVAALAASRSRLAGRIDMSRIAMVGHSSGFLSQTCTYPRVLACINLAGVPRMVERRAGLDRPLLTIHDASGSPTQTAIVATMRATAYDLYLRNSNHNSSSDLGLFDAETRDTAERHLRLISAYSVAFLDFVLSNKPAPLLVPSNAPDPEAVLTRYGPLPENSTQP